MPIVTPTALEPVTLSGLYPEAMDEANWAELDAENGNFYPATGREVLVFRNVAETMATVTIVSTDDPYGRSEDLVEEIGSGATRVVMLGLVGWRQSDRTVHLFTEDDDVLVLVIRLPTGAGG